MKEFIKKHEIQIVLIIGFILVAFVSFEVGLFQGKKALDKPIVIEKPITTEKIAETTTIEPQSASLSGNRKVTSSENTQTVSQNTTSSETLKKCVFVGSKNSNKYHLPTCRWAKQIKPENLVCFKTLEEAIQKGYLPDKNCIK